MSMTEQGLNMKTDAHLKDVALVQHLFKPGQLQSVAVAVGRAFAAAPSACVWADEVALPPLDAASKNVVGTAWKQLARWQ